MNVLQEELLLDPVKTTLSELSSLGLVQITRKRTRESLQDLLCKTCLACEGRGYVNEA